MDTHFHTGTPTEVERDRYDLLLDLAGADADATVLAGVEDFGALTRSRLDYCVHCREEVVGAAAEDPVRAATLLLLCFQVLYEQVRADLLREGMAYQDETAGPFAAISKATGGHLACAQIGSISEVVAAMAVGDRYALLDTVVHHAGFVCDEAQLYLDQSGRPQGHPFIAYAEHLRWARSW